MTYRFKNTPDLFKGTYYRMSRISPFSSSCSSSRPEARTLRKNKMFHNVRNCLNHVYQIHLLSESGSSDDVAPGRILEPAVGVVAGSLIHDARSEPWIVDVCER